MDIPADRTTGTRALIDVAAFRRNLNAVRSYVGAKVKILVVVKANGYGHGALRLAQEAVRWGVDYLGVARIQEAIDLRREGVALPILVFEIPPADLLELAVNHDLDLTAASLFDVRLLNAVAHRLGKRVSVHVKVDTGMGRLGFECKEAVGAVKEIASLGALRLTGLYSHFATSEDPDRSFALQQINRFTDLCSRLENLGVMVPLKHMANSGAIIDLPEAHFDMVRPGIMLYGYPPSREMRERYPVVPVMSLVSQVTFLKTVGPNTSISYGRRYFTTQKTSIATVPVGYADGLSRLLTTKAEVLIRERRYPVVGTICMDAVMIDLGREHDIELGDTVTFVGRQGNEAISAWDLAAAIGTIPYEVTCLITERVPRVYVNL